MFSLVGLRFAKEKTPPKSPAASTLLIKTELLPSDFKERWMAANKAINRLAIQMSPSGSNGKIPAFVAAMMEVVEANGLTWKQYLSGGGRSSV